MKDLPAVGTRGEFPLVNPKHEELLLLGMHLRQSERQSERLS